MSLPVSSSLTSEDIILSVLHLLSEMSWPELTYKILSNELKTRPFIIHRYFKSKTDILKGIIDFADRRMKDLYDVQYQDQFELTCEENLFEIILCRLEALTPYKKAFFHLTQTVWHNPLEALEISPYFLKSLKNILRLSGVETSNFTGIIKIQTFIYIYSQIIYQWFQDTSSDQSLTLIAIDKNLSKFMKILTKY